MRPSPLSPPRLTACAEAQVPTPPPSHVSQQAAPGHSPGMVGPTSSTRAVNGFASEEQLFSEEAARLRETHKKSRREVREAFQTNSVYEIAHPTQSNNDIEQAHYSLSTSPLIANNVHDALLHYMYGHETQVSNDSKNPNEQMTRDTPQRPRDRVVTPTGGAPNHVHPHKHGKLCEYHAYQQQVKLEGEEASKKCGCF
eukprot:GHVN01030155.1.p1 GENE.GHVN01030155.1~~GHVN01030155.1.p1  ORF type:complete len:205 (-),score=55.13 GHVN01030155.1:207-800(-)